MNSDFHPQDAAVHHSAGWAHTSNETPAQTLPYQSWTADNLCVESFHEQTRYFTSR